MLDVLESPGIAIKTESAAPKQPSDAVADSARKHTGLIFAVCYSVLRHREDAEDAAQECFLRLMRYRYRLAFALDQRAFVARVAQRCAIDRLNSARAKREDPIEELELPHHSDAAAVEDRLELRALRQMIATLPEELRRVIELLQTGELDSKQIGKVLGIPAATVRSRTARAKQLLREKLEARRKP